MFYRTDFQSFVVMLFTWSQRDVNSIAALYAESSLHCAQASNPDYNKRPVRHA